MEWYENNNGICTSNDNQCHSTISIMPSSSSTTTATTTTTTSNLRRSQSTLRRGRQRRAQLLADLEQEVMSHASSSSLSNCSRNISSTNDTPVEITVVVVNDIPNNNDDTIKNSIREEYDHMLKLASTSNYLQDVMNALERKRNIHEYEHRGESIISPESGAVETEAVLNAYTDFDGSSFRNMELQDLESRVVRKVGLGQRNDNVYDFANSSASDNPNNNITPDSFEYELHGNDEPSIQGNDDDDDERATIKPPSQRSLHEDFDFDESSLVIPNDDYGNGNLAVAIAVEDSDDMIRNLPSAQPHTETTTRKYTSRLVPIRFLMLTSWFVAFIVAALIAGLTICDRKHQDEPMILSRLSVGIRENLERFISQEQLDDETSPYRKALDWIIFDDAMGLTSQDPHLYQRFLVVYLYYATSAKKPWETDCAPSNNIHSGATNTSTAVDSSETCRWNVVVDRVGLDDLQVDEYVEMDSVRWLSGRHECTWAGIHCDKSFQVHTLEMGGFGLSGTFPDGIAMFPFLETIRFQKGYLDGPLPENLSSYKNLLHVDLDENLFTGTIPMEWYNLRSVQEIKIRNNKISGSIPSRLSEIRDMKKLVLDSNLFEGSIPNEIGSINHLKVLSLKSNKLHGIIPTAIGNLKVLEYLLLSNNRFTGTIPSEIGICTKLMSLELNNNLLKGTIPHEFYRKRDSLANSILILQLNNNHLTGNITRSINKFTKLEYLRIQHNHFSGNLSQSALGTIKNLQNIRLEGNDFTGTIPTEVCTNFRSQKSNHIKYILQADCAVPKDHDDNNNNKTLIPEVVCPHGCCTACCNYDGNDCQSNYRI